ncbi:MAG: HEAT repeat domain-containing protein [Cyclobacteriaceae bacterium]|nr:HEAT repeat domain-containing protein [Cyclobacteriaceae bacterium]
MEKEKLESLLIDYIDNNLDEGQRLEVEKILEAAENARELYRQLKQVLNVMESVSDLEPRQDHRGEFERTLETESTTSAQGRTVFFQPVFYRAAAGIALLIAGVAVGYWLNANNQRENELASLKQEMAETKSMMMAMLQNDLSASKRMQGVNVAFEMKEADDDILKALAHTMENDPNTNVRLAALEALSKFIGEARVKKILVSSLTVQKDPVVQIALIQLLVKIKEKGVVQDLEKIIEDEKNIQAVKDEAYTGILTLS